MRRRREAALFLASYGLSTGGNSVVGVLLPLVVIQQLRDPLGAAVVAAGSAVPGIVAGLFLGVVIDRIDRRWSASTADALSALAVGALPVIAWTGELTLGWLLGLALVRAVGEVPGVTAREAMVPAVVARSGVPIERLTAMRETVGAGAMILGPAAAGALLGILGPATALWVASACCASAAVTVLVLDRVVGRPDAGEQGTAVTWAAVREGWGFIRRTPVLRSIIVVTAVMIAVLGAVQGMILPTYFTEIDRSDAVGFVLVAFAAGSLVGGGSFAFAGPRVPRRLWLSAGIVLSAAGIATIGSLASIPVILAGAAALGAASGALVSLLGVVLAERVPDRLRGRVFGVQNAVSAAVPPLGIGAAAVCVHLVDVHFAGVAVAAAWLVTAVVVLVLPALGQLAAPGSPGRPASSPPS
ncbi:MFS transporter [Microbacterium betulae]|uniref:Multidrug efflux pump Tap n=1 Tax=Microbacterium betulae TaxID=2981139 RepID=A0AA97FHY7_9MICO|nr:MFS transporter [Microbacterium sp. AB]WOF23013.1 MFS transporter [Microbacterium sp. AB]